MPVPVNEAILALNRHNQRIAQSLVQRDDDVSGLLVSQSSSLKSAKAMERLSHDTAVSQLSLLSGCKQYRKRITSSVQPFQRVCDQFRTFAPSNEDRVGMWLSKD